MSDYLHNLFARFLWLLPVIIPAAALAVFGVLDYARRSHRRGFQVNPGESKPNG